MKLKVSVHADNGGYTTKEVNGEIVPNKFVKAFVHKNIEHPSYWAVSEFYTGMGLVGYGSSDFFKTKQEAIDDFEKRAANAQYFPNPEDRKKYMHDAVESIIKEHGKVNDDC